MRSIHCEFCKSGLLLAQHLQNKVVNQPGRQLPDVLSIRALRCVYLREAPAFSSGDWPSSVTEMLIPRSSALTSLIGNSAINDYIKLDLAGLLVP
jgi:hypothetical protein